MSVLFILFLLLPLDLWLKKAKPRKKTNKKEQKDSIKNCLENGFFKELFNMIRQLIPNCLSVTPGIYRSEPYAIRTYHYAGRLRNIIFIRLQEVAVAS